jgi:hypothetical protein
MVAKLNPLLTTTAAPAIPEAKAWEARYRGTKPLIDLSRLVPGLADGAERRAAAGGRKR